MELHQHLAECSDCRRIFDDYQRIRSGFRDLPPSPPPPPDLARSVWSETVDRTPPTRLRRIVGETTTRVGLATAAVLAVVIVVSAFLLVRGYNQNLPPSASSNIANAGQNWPIYQPIEIAFNKPMNHKSVEESLQIFPPGERDRIPLSWDHNTLIVGASSSKSALFLPDTNYRVLVLAGARDSYGQALPDTVSVTFRTSSIADASNTPTVTPSSTSSVTTTPDPSQQSANVPPPSVNTTPVTPPSGESTSASTTPPESPTEASSQTPASTPTPPRQQSTPANTGNAVSTPTPSAATPTPTPKSTTTPSPASTPTETPSPAATPSAAATPESTPTPTPAATPVVTASPSNGTPTTTVIPVTGAFGSVYWANSDVQGKLGEAQAPEAHLNAAELGFQRGTMYERFDTSQIYVLFGDGQWSTYPDTWTAAEGDGGGPAPNDQQLWIPKGSFGKVWSSDPGLETSIGYAVNTDAHLMGGVIQQFANGIMLYSDQGFVYVLYDDGSWMLYPDTSGHGDLITPTPTTGDTPISTPDTTPVPDTSDAPAPTSTTP